MALFWKVGWLYGCGMGQFPAPFDEASEGACVRGRGGPGLASVGPWLARGYTSAVGWALRGAGLLRRGGCVPSAVRGSGRSGCGAGGLAAEAGARGSVAVLLRLDMVPHGHAAGV